MSDVYELRRPEQTVLYRAVAGHLERLCRYVARPPLAGERLTNTGRWNVCLFRRPTCR